MLEFNEISLEEDHYNDDDYDGLTHDDEWHFDMVTGEWCHCSHAELEEAKILARELAPFYRIAKYSLVVGMSSAWIMAIFMFVN